MSWNSWDFPSYWCEACKSHAHAFDAEMDKVKNCPECGNPLADLTECRRREMSYGDLLQMLEGKDKITLEMKFLFEHNLHHWQIMEFVRASTKWARFRWDNDSTESWSSRNCGLGHALPLHLKPAELAGFVKEYIRWRKRRGDGEDFW